MEEASDNFLARRNVTALLWVGKQEPSLLAYEKKYFKIPQFDKFTKGYKA
ncbi:MAG: hypothetical protein XD84_2004 [Desulfotomaculum sp. 46_80]|nr:MAG: hypothetical protein XD84_2004 [Desulfotomaculum sp. 46_80]